MEHVELQPERESDNPKDMLSVVMYNYQSLASEFTNGIIKIGSLSNRTTYSLTLNMPCATKRIAQLVEWRLIQHYAT